MRIRLHPRGLVHHDEMVQEGRDEQEVLDLPFGQLRVGGGERVDCLWDVSLHKHPGPRERQANNSSKSTHERCLRFGRVEMAFYRMFHVFYLT